MTSTDLAFAIREGERPSEALARAVTPADRKAVARYAIEECEVKGLRLPVPRFLLELPWDTDNEATVDAILENLYAAGDLEEATGESSVLKADDLVGQTIVVEGLVVRPSDLEDGRWGGYLLLQVTLESGETVPVSSGAAQVMVTLARLHTEGNLPARGQFVKLGAAKTGRSQPIGFRYEPAF